MSISNYFSVSIDNVQFNESLNYFVSLKIADKNSSSHQIFRTDVSHNTTNPLFRNRHFSFTGPISAKTKLLIDVLTVLSSPSEGKKGQAKVLGSLTIPLKPILSSLSSSLPYSETFPISSRSNSKQTIGSLTIAFFTGSLDANNDSQQLSATQSLQPFTDASPLMSHVYIYSGDSFYSP
ncbi:hypothetical protein GEMRC1_004103 [Eukaryota sp. GEM-RC1]